MGEVTLTFGLIAKLYTKIEEKDHITSNKKVYDIIVISEILLKFPEYKDSNDIETGHKMRTGSCYHKLLQKSVEALVELDVDIDNTYFEKFSMPHLLSDTDESITKLCQYEGTEEERDT